MAPSGASVGQGHACVCVCDKPRKGHALRVTMHGCLHKPILRAGVWMCMTTHHSKEMNQTHTQLHSKGSMLCQSSRLYRGAHTQGGGNHAPGVANLKLMTNNCEDEHKALFHNRSDTNPKLAHITANQIPTTIVLPHSLTCLVSG